VLPLQIFALAKQPAADRAAAFVPSQPGNFVSISNKTGKQHHAVGSRLRSHSQLYKICCPVLAQCSICVVMLSPRLAAQLQCKRTAGVLQLWNVSQQQPLKSLKIGKGPAQSVQFLPGSSRALLTFQDGKVRCCDALACSVLYHVCCSRRLQYS
jgi:hypothetical protein